MNGAEMTHITNAPNWRHIVLRDQPRALPSEASRSIGSEYALGVASAMLQAMPLPATLIDPSMRIVAANDEASDLLGLGLSRINLTERLPSVDASSIIAGLSTLNGHKESFHTKVVRPDGGDEVDVRMTAKRIDLGRDAMVMVSFERIEAEDAMAERICELEERLAEADHGLHAAMRATADGERRLQEQMRHHINVEILPALRKMAQSTTTEAASSFRQVIENRLSELVQLDADESENELQALLSPTEAEVCGYIKAGLGSKEIAEAMNLAFETIQTHRKNIRRKLGLRGRKMALQTFLKTRTKKLHF